MSESITCNRKLGGCDNMVPLSEVKELIRVFDGFNNDDHFDNFIKLHNIVATIKSKYPNLMGEE